MIIRRFLEKRKDNEAKALRSAKFDYNKTFQLSLFHIFDYKSEK